MSYPFRLCLVVALIVSIIIPAHADDRCRTDDDDCSVQSYGIPLSKIVTHPAPDVEMLPIVDDQLHDRWYKRVEGEMQVFDSPNGVLIRTQDAGFNFVTALHEQDGWTQINRDEWVSSEQLTTSNTVVSRFTGALLPDEPLPYTMGWLLENLYPSQTPGGQPHERSGRHLRYQPVYVYATVEIDGDRWYQIGIEKWIHQHQIAKVLPVERPADVTTDQWISIDLYEQVVIAYEGERAVFATLAATGMAAWPTREGTFNIYLRRIRNHMSGGVPGDDFYFLEDVPWTMYFDEARALHGAYWHDGFGFRRSHGCVNLTLTDSRWLYEWVTVRMETDESRDFEEGPAVYVYSSGEYD